MDTKDLEARLEKLEQDVAANNLIADGVHALQESLMKLVGEIGGFDAMRTWYDRVEKELEATRGSIEQNTKRVDEAYEHIKEYYTVALDSFYKDRDAAYGQLKPDVLVKEVVELLRQDAQAELEFRKQLIDTIAEKISARFNGVVPVRNATRVGIERKRAGSVTRPTTHAEAMASISQEHQRRQNGN